MYLIHIKAFTVVDLALDLTLALFFFLVFCLVCVLLFILVFINVFFTVFVSLTFVMRSKCSPFYLRPEPLGATLLHLPAFFSSFPTVLSLPRPRAFHWKSLDLVFGMLFGWIWANIPPLRPSEIIKCQRDFENMQSADKWYWFLLRLNKSKVGPILFNCSVQGCYFLQFLQRIAKSVKRNYKEAY